MRIKLRESAEFGFEYTISFPIFEENGSEFGTVRFYHAAGEDYPISAIAVLSQNVGNEFEKALQRILCAEKSAMGMNRARKEEWFAPEITPKIEHILHRS